MQTSNRIILSYFKLFILFNIFILAYSGCGGSGGSNTGDDTPQPGEETPPLVWNKYTVESVSGGGFLIPNIVAVPGTENDIHLTFFNESTTRELHYVLNYLHLNTGDFSIKEHQTFVEIDNCRTLSLAVDTENHPVFAYQGGVIRECGSEQQSDIMVGIWKDEQFSEHTGAIGFVERNPVFQDGLAGTTISATADDSGNIHVCYQFFYEGCDAMNFNFPDLLYTEKNNLSLSEETDEESISQNVYNPNGTASVQNDVGDHAKIITDRNNSPVVFYYADLQPVMPSDDLKGLRVSRKTGDTWEHAFIETGVHVGAISCAKDKDGNLAVAYYVDGEYEDSLGTHKNCLKFAWEKDGAWETQMVDESAITGEDCALSFDGKGNPAIAYYAIENHSGSREMKDLRFAIQNGTSWEKEAISEEGDIGTFNSLWFDDEDTPHVCSYLASRNEICIFVKE